MKIKEVFKDRKGKLFGDIAIAIFFGIMLILAGDMVFGKKDNARPPAETVQTDLSEGDYISRLEEKTKGLLSQVEGAGNVDVMITLKESQYTRRKTKKVRLRQRKALHRATAGGLPQKLRKAQL